MKTIKLCVAFFALLFILSPLCASAQVIHYDSAALQEPWLYTFGASDTVLMLGNPDGNCAHFTGDAGVALRFRVGSQEITMQKGAAIHIYWKISSLTPGDSNVGIIRVQRVDDNLQPNGIDSIYHIKELTQVNVEGMTTIIVPDTGRNAIGVEVGADAGGNSFWIDAITLVQAGEAGVSGSSAPRQTVLASYPNPFEHASPVTVHIDAPNAGRGVLLISDALGREVERISTGELHSGAQEVTVGMDRAGVFFARLYIDGAPVGGPLQLIAK